MTKSDAGRLGGIATAAHSHEEHRAWGLLGGRPRALTYSQLTVAPENNLKENRLPTGLRELKELWKSREKSSSVIDQGAGATE